MLRITLAVLISTVAISTAEAKRIRVGTTLPATGIPSGVDNPSCTAEVQSQKIGDRLEQKALNLVGKGSQALGLGNDPFNVRRLNRAVCADLCGVVPPGADFTARGSFLGCEKTRTTGPEICLPT
jgi:hypothetical protein